MIRFRNPGTQYTTQVQVFKELYKEYKDAPSFDLDDMASTITKTKLMTAYGYAGEAALALSNTENDSLNSTKMNAKMYAEVFRLLGWITSVGNGSYPLVFTYIGEHAASTDDVLPLYEQCVLGINNPQEIMDVKYDEKVRFFKAALFSLEDLDGIMYKHELCLGPMSIDDLDEKQYRKMIAYLRGLRGSYRRYEVAYKALCDDLQVKPTLPDNSTRLPIESIYFGNWFDIARNFISKDSIFELTHPYRTQNRNLLTVWERVRNLDIAILEPMVKSKYSVRLDESIFSHAEEDEIILCLNYDGLYGINNINRFLQNSNPSPAIQWGIGLYKVGDPVLFNESDRFSPLIHNNSKGRIVGITTEELKIWFEIELDCAINELDAWGYDFELMDVSESGNSIIKFSVDKYRSTDEDDDYSDTVVPFQVAYAVSIHKAQGLEYRSVKIVITNETEERITHNIFYTAITRAKENLKIYWSPETEKSVLGRLEVRDSRRDANLLKQLYSL